MRDLCSPTCSSLTLQAAGWTDALNEFAYAGYDEANAADVAKPKPLPKQLSMQSSMANVLPPSPAKGPSSVEPALSSDPELSDL